MLASNKVPIAIYPNKENVLSSAPLPPNVSVNSKPRHPPGTPPGIRHFKFSAGQIPIPQVRNCAQMSHFRFILSDEMFLPPPGTHMEKMTDGREKKFTLGHLFFYFHSIPSTVCISLKYKVGIIVTSKSVKIYPQIEHKALQGLFCETQRRKEGWSVSCCLLSST